MLTENKTVDNSVTGKPVYAEKINKVAWLYFNRPQAMNGINLELAQTFIKVMAELEQDDKNNGSSFMAW